MEAKEVKVLHKRNGRVIYFTDGRYIAYSDGRIYDNKMQRFLNGHTVKGGYITVGLYNKEGVQNVFLHRVILEVFNGYNNELNECNHINEDKTDNRLENLEWCTRGYNVNYGSRTSKAVATMQKKGHFHNTGVKLAQWSIDHQSVPVYQYDKNWNFIASFKNKKEASRITGVSTTCIYRHIKGLIKKPKINYNWSHLPPEQLNREKEVQQLELDFSKS